MKMVSRGGNKSPFNRGANKSPLSTLVPIKKESISGEVLKNYTVNGVNGISLGGTRNQQNGIRNKIVIKTNPAASTTDNISNIILL